MPMMSYAQNREDVRLARAFAGRTSGFYVDVGAHDPVTFSITKHFYDLGWHGLNIDASEEYANAIRAGRPRDVTLNVGVSNTPGTLTFYKGTRHSAGLSTFSAAEVARHRTAGYEFSEHSVQVVKLATLLDEHVKEPIDFMSIDVEGFEREVLDGAAFDRHRPKVVLVEATRPLSRDQSHERWEELLLAANYRFVVFDGLNRYYVAEEHAELAPALEVPPNPLDDYVPYEYQSQIDALRAKLEDDALPVRIARKLTNVSRFLSRRVLERVRS